MARTKKSQRDTAAARLEQVAQADKSEFERLVLSNSALKKEIWRIRRQRQLPPEGSDWNVFKLQLKGLEQEVAELADKYGAEDWIIKILEMIFSGESKEPYISDGHRWMFTWTRVYSKLGPPNLREKILSAEVDSRGGFNWPPEPAKVQGTRKLDWSPIWEWEKRNPTFTRRDIALLMGRNYGAVRAKLGEVDAEKGRRKL